MASYPGPTLEDWVEDVYIFDSPEEFAAKVAELEPAREYVEDSVLDGYDPETQSWREYRNWYIESVEKMAVELRQ